jgi:hypothetical protein
VKLINVSKRSADLFCRSAAFSFKSSPSHRLANARDQLSGHRASGRAEDARALLRQIYDTEVDLFPHAQNKTLTVRLHHLRQAAHDEAARHLRDELNAAETLFPSADLRSVRCTALPRPNAQAAEFAPSKAKGPEGGPRRFVLLTCRDLNHPTNDFSGMLM